MYKIWRRQLKINKALKGLSLKRKQKATKQMILSLMTEVTELLEEINWAPHKQKKKIIRSNIAEEIIDIFKYLLNVCLIWDISAKEFIKEFYRKTTVVEQKFINKELIEKLAKSKAKVCAVDLDGVLVDYPRCWVDFVNKKLGKDYKDLFEARAKTNKLTYLKLKNLYRESGYKRKLNAVKGASKFTQTLRRKGYKIIILTARPYKRYARLFADTKYWLDRKNIKYDAILFDANKHLTIIKQVPHLRFMVEDNRKLANDVANWGYKAFLLDNYYNQGSTHKKVVRIKKLNDILRNC